LIKSQPHSHITKILSEASRLNLNHEKQGQEGFLPPYKNASCSNADGKAEQKIKDI
jgi:hypothetical protein